MGAPKQIGTCKKCGGKLYEHNRFCGGCGARVANALPKIAKTTLVATDTSKKVGSTIGRAIAGSFLLGPAGIAAGLTGKNKQEATFVVKYDDGHKEMETVEVGSEKFNEYCMYLD